MGFAGLTTDHCAHWSQSQILQWQVSAGANTVSYLQIWRTVKKHCMSVCGSSIFTHWVTWLKTLAISKEQETSTLKLNWGFTKASSWAPAHVRTKRRDLHLHKIHWLCPPNLGKEAKFSWLHSEEPLEEEEPWCTVLSKWDTSDETAFQSYIMYLMWSISWWDNSKVKAS